MRGAIRKFIESSTSYKICDEAADGASAIQKVKEFSCDLILLDLNMPTSGVETASALRATLPRTKIVGFTAHSADVAERLFAATGFDAILSKQDGLLKLIETLRVLIPVSAD